MGGNTIFTLVGGVTGEVLGGAASVTGIGAAVGVPAIAISTTLVVGGAGNILSGLQALTTGGSGSGPPQTKASASEGAKRGPKTDPNAPHNAAIRAEADRLISEGNKIVAGGGRAQEQLIQTPGGAKSGRRPDIIYLTPSGVRRGVNVGRTKADGSPVLREQKALDDLNGPGGLTTDFVPYE